MSLAIPAHTNRHSMALMDTETLSGEVLPFNPDALGQRANEVSVDRLCSDICHEWRQSISSIINTGRLLIQLRDQSDHGSWLSIVEERLPFSKSTASRLVQIANNPEIVSISQDARAHHLPQSWSLLAELASLSGDQIRSAVDEGLIHSEMRRAELRDITRRLRYAQTGEMPSPAPVAFDSEIAPEVSAEDQIHARGVAAIVAFVCHITPEELFASSRGSPSASLARHLWAYILRTSYNWTSQRIADVIGRDRTTISHSCEVMEDLRDDALADQWITDLVEAACHTQTLAERMPWRKAA